MLPMGNMEMVIFFTTFIPMDAMHLFIHAGTFCTLAHMTSIPVRAMYLHARTFCSPRGRVDDSSFFEYLSLFCFCQFNFIAFFSISCKIIPFYVY